MGDDSESFAWIIGNIVGESMGHFIGEGDFVVEFWSEKGKIGDVGEIRKSLSAIKCAS